MASVTSSIPGCEGEPVGESPVLSVERLRTYFHTYEGVVKAVEDVDLEVRAGETVGLVGETGCGKSVTALSILRLVPNPPGVIEGGRVFFSEPADVRAFRKDFEALARGRMKSGGAQPNLSSARIQEVLRPEIEELGRKLSAATTDSERAGIRRRVQAATSAFDILQRSEEEMRLIRGDQIAMIFQEPMTALNPVFTIGDQIAETLILHRQQELCRRVLAALDLQLAARSSKKKGARLPAKESANRFLGGRSSAALSDEERETYERLSVMKAADEVCSLCYSRAPELWDYCPSCGARLRFDWWAPFRSWTMRLEKRLYTRMLEDPEDQLVDFLRTIRVLRRLVRSRLNDEGVRWAVDLLADVKIPEPERIAGQYPFELSGGMRQRSMIAMMMACNPKLLIADEPTTALDVTVEAQILKLMRELQQRTDMAVLLITHDLGIVAEICNKVAVMYAGNIAEFGTTEQIFLRTLHPYTSGLMKAIPRFTGELSQERKKELYIIKGSVPNLLHPPSGCRFHPRCPRVLEKCKTVVPELEEMEPGHFAACHNPVPRGGVPS